MTLILTNDDGIDAPGIRALQQAIEGVVVAPLHQHSGCGHQVTTHRPIGVDHRSPRAFAIDGTPADCTRIALSYLQPTQACDRIQGVISGINAGGNLGADVYISGTVAAVREAALHRVPGIAISHFIRRGKPIDWDLATKLAGRVLDKLLSLPWEPHCFWNVNLPHVDAIDPAPEIVFCPPCTQPLPAVYRRDGESLHYAGDYGKRDRDPGSDVEVCFSGHIAVTQLRI